VIDVLVGAEAHWGLWGLFFSSFISATLAPGGSEILLVYLLVNDVEPVWRLWLVATIGNTLGGFSSWLIGFLVASGYWPPEKVLVTDNHQKVLTFLQRWGVSALLLSWLPVVGDVLCLLAGWLKLSSTVSIVAMFAGKGARYAVVVYLQSWVGNAV
jgi:membrane protein YqaA with SNARE-associated domain